MSETPALATAPPSGPAGGDTRLWLLKAAKVVVVFIYAFVLIDLVMLLLGFCLRLFGASTDAAFTRWVYRGVDRIMEPFRGMFPSRPISEQSVLDVSLLFAMIVYCIVAIALHALVVWLAEKIVALHRRQRLAEARAREVLAVPVPPPAPGAPITQQG